MPTARLVVNTKKRVGVVPAKKMKNELRKAYEAGQLFGTYVTFEEYYNELQPSTTTSTDSLRGQSQREGDD